MGTLYLVGTPIGNLEDISLRGLRILSEVDLIAAEDTRHTGRLLKHHNIPTPMTSYHEHSGPGRIAELLDTLSRSDVALVSDAGTPGLSDPGYRLIRAAIEAGLEVVAVPGPSAAVMALVSSGLPTDSFLFLGFLPRQKRARKAALSQIASLPYTLILYEAPHRLLALLSDIELILGNRLVSVGRELTKLHEQTWRGSVADALAHFSQSQIRGEITVVIAGATTAAEKWSEQEVRSALTAEIAKGISRKEAAALVALQSGWSKRELYRLTIPSN